MIWHCQNRQDRQNRAHVRLRRLWQSRRYFQVRRSWQCGVAVLLCCAAAASANNRYDPRLRFRTLSTPHFDIHFHQQEEQQARRLATIAEDVADALASTLGRPDARVHVILVNQNDQPNGWATPVPYNLMEVTAAAPTGDSNIGNTDDWLRLVFTHEYTHIVHLSRRRGWLGALHSLFGRIPVAYPNLFLPTWQIEGLAVFEESARTGEGRLPAPDFGQIVSRAAAAGRFEPIDRTNGGLVDWPAGAAPYAYGGYFQRYLADRFGEASLRRLTDRTAGRIPFFGSGAYKRVFGRPLGDLWKDFREDSRQRAGREMTTATRLTRHGFNVDAPRFGSDGAVFYSVANPHGFPSLMRISADGSRDRQIIRRFLGNRTAVAGHTIVFDQLELANNVALQSDLYVLDLESGRLRRLTRGARAADPDVSRDGATIVCTVQQADRRELATMPLKATEAPVRTLVSEAGADYSAPRWSPDGRWIAAERRRPGARAEIVVVDARTGAVRVIASAPAHRSITPAWMPDGSRLLFASDRGGGVFGVFSVDVSTGALRRLAGTGSTSVRAPDVSPDGSRLAFIGYTVDGYDVFTVDLESARWTTVDDAAVERSAEGGARRDGAAASFKERRYAPWRTLIPTSWTPTAATDNDELVIGAATGAADVLGREAYVAQAGWTSARSRPDWSVVYAYDRWRPTWFVDYSDDTDPFRSGEIRTREADIGMLFPIRRIRWSQALFAAWNASTDDIDCGSCVPALDLRARRRSMRTGWSFDSSKSYGYSVSAEEGVRVSAAAEFTRRGFGADGDAGAATLDVRGYLPVLPMHAAVAARFAAATAWGDQVVRRRFSASGAGPQSSSFDFGTDAVGLLRGFPEADVAGDHAVVVNLDYRVPLLRVQRGAGTFPFFLRTIHAAVFADAGNAWTGGFDSHGVRTAAGLELSMDTVVGFALPLAFTTGAAWRHDPSGRDPGLALFVRVGRAF